HQHRQLKHQLPHLSPQFLHLQLSHQQLQHRLTSHQVHHCHLLGQKR
ncbi:hypothetical protein Golax_017236, partial [Gossypium laxum]|nr:hypothetical protein [Gossypium laxum]